MEGTSVMAGMETRTEQICTSPYPIEKIKGSLYPYPYTINTEFPVKTGTGSGNTHGSGFICHPYFEEEKLMSTPKPLGQILRYVVVISGPTSLFLCFISLKSLVPCRSSSYSNLRSKSILVHFIRGGALGIMV